MRIEFETDTKKQSNEDICGLTKKGAFVLDGASALTYKNYTPSGNDVNWMVNWWKKYLEANLDDTRYTIQEIIKKGIDNFNIEYGKFVNIESLKDFEKLSAGIAVARKNQDYLEAYVLGDVEITLETKNGEYTHITDDFIKNLDSEVISMISKNNRRNSEIVFKGFTQEEMDILIRNRSKMNKPGGYYILSHEKEAVDKGVYKKIKIEEVERCLLATDGITPLSTRYTKKTLLENLRSKGVKEIIKELRTIEESDIHKKTIGRLKTHDDATLVYMDFGFQY
jgi:serine/threonine protein phosphatase PrpC